MVDTTVHVAEAVGRADHRIAVQAEQVALQDLDATDVEEGGGEGTGDVGVPVAQADP